MEFDIKKNDQNEKIIYDECEKEYLLPEYSKEEISNNDHNINYDPFSISPCILNYFTYVMSQNHVIDKGIKAHNSIKVYNFYLKKKYKYQHSREIYNKSKIRYFFSYLYNLTKKYVIKDLRRILLYNFGIFFAEKLGRMIYKLIKKHRALRKK